MEVGESKALFGNLIDVGGTNFTTEAAYIRETEIVCDNNEEIGAFGCHCRELLAIVLSLPQHEPC